MRKILISIILVCCVAMPLIFASEHSITIQALPFSYQLVRFNLPIEYSSQYGWGAKVGYGYNYSQVSSIGADFSISDYKYSGVSEHYIVLSALAKAAFFFPADGKFHMTFDVGGGADLRILNSKAKFNPTAGLYFGFGYEVSRNVEISAGGDFRYSWQTNSDSYYNSDDFAILTNLGVKINL